MDISDNNIYGGLSYTTKPLQETTSQQQHHQYYSCYTTNMPIINNQQTTTSNNNVLESFNNALITTQQTSHKNENIPCNYTDHLAEAVAANWGDVEKTLKLPEKMDMIEITSKDLSPASYCSNLDFFMPDFYKTISKEMNYYNKYESQWYTSNGSYNNQKMSELPSCAQVNQSSVQIVDKTVKYCSIQKPPEFVDSAAVMMKYNNSQNQQISGGVETPATVTMPEHNFYYNNNKSNNNNKNDQIDQDYNNIYSNYYNMHQQLTQQQQYFYQQIPSANNNNYGSIDQQTECSNDDESDIVVEDSEEELGDCCNDFNPEKKPHNCIICNLSNTHLGTTQFYYLTNESPLTMSSQKPVYCNLIKILSASNTININNKRNYLCSECLGLINTIDHLQFKLDSFNAELLMKFQRTCNANNISSCRAIRARRKIPTYKCKFCSKILSFKTFCQYHVNKHKFKGFLCELCGTISRTRHRFRLHMRGHRSATTINSFKCSNCSKNFRTKSNRKEHENYCLGTLPYSCQHHLCDKKFASLTKLRNHVKLKHDKKFIAICSICNIGFIKASDYKSHMISHSTDKKFTCGKCDKSYKTLSNLNFHRKIHEKKMPFICDICNKGFMRKEYLEAHVNNHNGIKNYVCNICNKKFVAQKNLDSHLKYHDGAGKTTICNICGKNVTSGFEEHLRIHNNLREFECDVCNFKFNTKGTLGKHKKLKHSEKLNKIVDVEIVQGAFEKTS